MTAHKNIPDNILTRCAITGARIIYPCTRLLSIIAMIASAAMALTVAADVFMRRVFNSPIFGTYDIINILLVVIVFCAVADVQAQRRHVIVDTLTQLYPAGFKLLASGIGQLLSICLMSVIAWQTFKYGMAMKSVGESMVLTRIPVAPFLFLVAFGYLLFILVFVVQFLYTLAGIEEVAAEKQLLKEVRRG